jgi:DNA-binding transcriptional LysR family regulator
LSIRFTLDQLEVVEAIHRFGGFGAAAKQLHRATSAVSYSVKSLESALGVRIFERTGRRPKLTAAGESALEAARHVLERSRGLERLGHDLQAGWEPELRVVIDGALPLPPAVRAFKRFLGRGVSTKLQLSVEFLSGVRRRFDRDEAHFMLGVEVRPDGRLVTRALPAFEMLLVVHRSHALAKSKKTVDRAGLASHVEILVPDSGLRDGGPPNRVAFVGSPHAFEVSDFHSKREAIAAGLGFGWLPRHLVADDLRRRSLSLVRYSEGNRYMLQPVLAYRGDAPLGPAARLLLEAFDEFERSV